MMGVQHKAVGIGFGMALFMYTTSVTKDPYGGLALVGSTIGCMLPDIDHDNSRIGRRRAFVTRMTGKMLTAIVSIGIVLCTAVLILAIVQMDNPVSNTSFTQIVVVLLGLIAVSVLRKVINNSRTFRWMTKHRGLMHTLVVPVILAYACTASGAPLWHDTFLGLTVGYCSHLLADMLTVEGCPILFPITKNNVRILKLQTRNSSTWLAAIILATLPVIVMYYITGGF